jgi:single-strand DNA-binding protein
MASRSVNKVILVGNLGKDADTKFTPSGTAKSTFSVATGRRWKDKESGEWKEETDWHNVVLWRQEKTAQYLLRGTQVYIEGRLTTRSYDKNGEKRYITEVVADDVILLSKPAVTGLPKDHPAYDADFDAPAKPAPRNLDITDDDVPW